MKSRREFLKEAAAGAVLVGSTGTANRLAFAAIADLHAAGTKSKVVIARDPALHGTAGGAGTSRAT